MLLCVLTSMARAQNPPSIPPGEGAAPQPVQAQPTAAQLEAHALFIEGRQLLEQGRTELACERLIRSQQLAPTIGTLLNLGLCHRRLGRLASARHWYQAAELLARTAGDSERMQLAHAEASGLEAVVSKLTLAITDRGDAGLEVSVDGLQQARDRWGLPLELDAGEHEILAQAPGKIAWRERVVMRDGLNRLVTVPPLVLRSEQPASRRAPRPAEALEPVPSDTSGDTQRTAAYSLGGLGVAGTGLGVLFMILARNRFDDSESHCTRFDVCDPAGVELRRQAQAHATRATVATGIGIAALVGAAALWITAPRDEATDGAVRFEVGADAQNVRLQLRL
jgi:hypothetical protein